MSTTTPDDDLCTWSDLPASQCAHCLGQESTPPDRESVLRWFEARFPSNLACGHMATTGSVIGVTTGGDYVCRRCGS